MNPDRWEQISRIWDAALEVAEDERPVFLEQACQGDAALRSEVESLLASHQQAESFLESPALEVAAEAMAAKGPPSLVGRALGAYQILSTLGAGGMGEVYKAKDIQSRINKGT